MIRCVIAYGLSKFAGCHGTVLFTLPNGILLVSLDCLPGRTPMQFHRQELFHEPRD